MNVLAEIEFHNVSVPNEEKLEDILKDICEIAVRKELIEQPVEVFVMIVDNDEIKSLNHQFRGLDRETDVLSFPLNELPRPLCMMLKEKEFFPEINPESGRISLGDIIISADKAKTQAEEYGHSFKREMAFLCAHGMLHLMGYDHIEEAEEQEMREKQRAILNTADIKRDSII